MPPGNPDLAQPLRAMLHANPELTARFPAVVDFPGYTPVQLIAILQALAAEAGLTLTPDAARKAVTVLADAENGHATAMPASLSSCSPWPPPARPTASLACPSPRIQPSWPRSTRPLSPSTCHPMTRPHTTSPRASIYNDTYPAEVGGCGGNVLVRSSML